MNYKYFGIIDEFCFHSFSSMSLIEQGGKLAVIPPWIEEVRQRGYSALPKGMHYCRCQQIRTGDLTTESPWSYPLNHNIIWNVFVSCPCLHKVILTYSLNKKEWICSLFKEWILEKSEIRVNLEWTFVLFTHFGVTSGITRNPWVIPVVTPKWVNNKIVHSKFTLISLCSKIHSLKSEHIHSFLFREYLFETHILAKN